MKYWVRYSEFKGGDTYHYTEIIDKHPLIWESEHERKGTMYGGPSLIDWKEIPDEVANKLARSSKP